MSANVRIEFPSRALKKDKKATTKKLDEIACAVCALANSKGGRVILYSKDGCYSEGDIDDITRRVEQKLNSTFSIVTREIDEESAELHFRVEALPSLSQPHTLKYNLHITSETQVIEVAPSSSRDKVMGIIKGTSRKRKLEDYNVIGHHHRRFVLGETVPLRESKDTQFKKLKDEKSTKGCGLASRITNTANKLTLYVSGFANGEGGHIYYGIKTNENDWSNVVEGQTVHDQDKITREVAKTIQNMTWPKENGVPQKGKHWEIFFEPVFGVNTSAESKFVIVISIAPFQSGVFVEEPESYKEADGEVMKLGYSEWKKRLCQHHISYRSEVVNIQQSIGRCSWSSSGASAEYGAISRRLVQLRNDGNRSEFQKYTKQLEESGSWNARVISQQQEAGYFLRESDFKKAGELLEENKELLRKSKDAAIFEVTWLYWVCIATRSQPERVDECDEIFTNAIQKIQSVPASLIGPWLFVQKARMLEMKIGEESETEEEDNLINECKESYMEALREASVLPDSPAVVALKQRVHITLARLHLRCFRCQGKLTRKKVCTKYDREEAQKMLEIVERSHNLQGWPRTVLGKCEYHMVRSEQDIRNWEQFGDPSYHKTAYKHSKKALKIANKLNFKFFSTYASDQLSYFNAS